MATPLGRTVACVYSIMSVQGNESLISLEKENELNVLREEEAQRTGRKRMRYIGSLKTWRLESFRLDSEKNFQGRQRNSNFFFFFLLKEMSCISPELSEQFYTFSIGIIWSLFGDQGVDGAENSDPPMPLSTPGSFWDWRRRQTALLPVPFHYFSLQLSLHFRVHSSARDSILGFVGTGWFRQIGSFRNLSKLVPLGLPACSEGRRERQRSCLRLQCPRHVQTGEQVALFQQTRAAGGQPASSLKSACVLAGCPEGQGEAFLCWGRIPRNPAETDPGFCENWHQIPVTSLVPLHLERTSRWQLKGAQFRRSEEHGGQRP